MKDYLALFRIPQYIKNLFIYLPFFFALKLTDLHLIVKVTGAFIAFSFIASAVYIFNDLCDQEDDRRHPQKKNRPIASGRISRTKAKSAMTLLFAAGITMSALLSLTMFYLVLFYTVLNLAYTLKLKHIAILDIVVIAIGFVLRIFVGGAVGEVKIYMWIVIMTFLLALFLALGKRRDDVLIYLNTNNLPRKSIDGYSLVFIDASMMIMAAITIVAYIMYTTSPEVMVKFGTDKLYLTALFVLLGILRYLQLSLVTGNSGNPTELLLKDRFIQITIIGWLVTFGVMIYLK
jgi:decaprenyl-phosphate phosphoribosyltransferase